MVALLALSKRLTSHSLTVQTQANEIQSHLFKKKSVFRDTIIWWIAGMDPIDESAT